MSSFFRSSSLHTDKKIHIAETGSKARSWVFVMPCMCRKHIGYREPDVWSCDALLPKGLRYHVPDIRAYIESRFLIRS